MAMRSRWHWFRIDVDVDGSSINRHTSALRWVDVAVIMFLADGQGTARRTRQFGLTQFSFPRDRAFCLEIFIKGGIRSYRFAPEGANP